MPKVTRRAFLGGAAGIGVGASFLGIQGLLSSVQASDPSIDETLSINRVSGEPRVGVPSICLQCPAACGIIGYSEDGRLVKIEGNPKHPNNRGKICGKGHAGLNQLYDPERILYPMRRTGKRGGGQWKRISWDEAYGEIVTRLKAIRQSGHSEEFLLHSGYDRTMGLAQRFMRAFGNPMYVEPLPPGGDNRRVAHFLTMGAYTGVPDVANTQYILNFGANPYEATIYHIPLAQRIIQGRVQKGTKMVTFDVRLSNTAGRSDEWISLKPGTDGVVALAMAHVIIRDGLHNRDFLDLWSNYSSDQLWTHLQQFTPEMAQEISGVSADEITRIAHDFATATPAVAISGSGSSRHENGTYNDRCVMLLNAITGNVDNRGGYCLPRSYQLGEYQPVPQAVDGHGTGRPALTPKGQPRENAATIMPSIQNGSRRVSLYMSYLHNAVYSDPNRSLTDQVLRDETLIPYSVAVDCFMSETTSLADLILPDTTYLESWGIDSSPSFEMVPFVAMLQPVVKPRGESASFGDVLIQLAHRIGDGMEQYFSTREDHLAAALSNVPGLAKTGGLDYLRQQGVWYDEQATPQYQAYESGGFATYSGRFETYSSEMEAAGYNPLPVFEPTAIHGELKDDQLILTTFKWGIHANSHTANARWLSEIVHDNPMWMNGTTAAQRGISDGDLVEVQTETGKLKLPVRLTQGIHPRVIAISTSLGHWAYGDIAQAKSSKSVVADTRFLWWNESGNGWNANNIVPIKADPIGGEQAWMGVLATVAKA